VWDIFKVPEAAILLERELMKAERERKRSERRAYGFLVQHNDVQQDVAEGKHFPINTKFQELFMDARSPIDGAMFTRNGSFGCEYLFSPAAAAFSSSLLREYSGVPCPAPKRSEARLIAGHSGSEHVPFASE
jgi:hypothetical protein